LLEVPASRVNRSAFGLVWASERKSTSARVNTPLGASLSYAMSIPIVGTLEAASEELSGCGANGIPELRDCGPFRRQSDAARALRWYSPGSNAPEYRWEYHLDRVGAKRLDRPGNAKFAFSLWSVTPCHGR
jgi:hypothetical protein